MYTFLGKHFDCLLSTFTPFPSRHTLTQTHILLIIKLPTTNRYLIRWWVSRGMNERAHPHPHAVIWPILGRILRSSILMCGEKRIVFCRCVMLTSGETGFQNFPVEYMAVRSMWDFWLKGNWNCLLPIHAYRFDFVPC